MSEPIMSPDLYLKYRSIWGHRKMKVNSYRFDDATQWVTNFGKLRITPPQFRKLLCNKCGSDNWTDDGRNMNEYCCDSCGQYVMVQGDDA